MLRQQFLDIYSIGNELKEKKETQLENVSQNAMLYLGKHLAFKEIFPLCVFGLCFCQAPQCYHLAWDQFVWLWLSVSCSFKYMKEEGMQEQQKLNSEKYSCTFNSGWHWTPLFLILTPKGYDKNFSQQLVHGLSNLMVFIWHGN